MINILFSDVDGCLIGQEVTCFIQISKEIKRISASFLVILTTGKTAHEIIQLNRTLHLPGPFIVENGHGILFKSPVPFIASLSKWIPLGDYCLFLLGGTKPDVSILKSLSPTNVLLTEMDDGYLAAQTGMSLEEACFAKRRFFTEPIYIKHLTDNGLKILKKQLNNKKLYYIQTSRFLHVATSDLNKGCAIRFLLKSLFAEQVNKTYSIGDSLSDFSMFAQCENNYFISNQPYGRIPKRCEVILEKELSGWSKIVSELLALS